MKALLAIAIALVLSSCSDSMHGHMNTNYSKSSYQSTGERIYLTGKSNANSPIVAIGGHHHMQMHGGSCATCHGPDREGGKRMWPSFWVTAPALTAHALSGDHSGDGHDHDTYDENSLKRAIIEGIRPDGETLDELMPRWQMSDQDLNALVHYLLEETSHPHNDTDDHQD